MSWQPVIQLMYYVIIECFNPEIGHNHTPNVSIHLDASFWGGGGGNSKLCCCCAVALSLFAFTLQQINKLNCAFNHNDTSSWLLSIEFTKYQHCFFMLNLFDTIYKFNVCVCVCYICVYVGVRLA